MIGNVASAAVKPVASFTRGFSYPLRAAKFLGKRPGLLKYLALPFSINVLIFSLSVYFGLDLFELMLETYAPGTEVWYGMILYYLAWTVALLLTAVVVFFSFTVVGNLIASPFNELLSERVE
ncbi:EI24 domain-containing protein, partial [Malonomonas rubra]|uniref:EI24 domain-containing protein n=1 Tax=Malonomonas rubra TaxID=57040 RepID=UPI0026EA7907